MPVLHYVPVLGGFEVFLKNIAERVSEHTDVFVLTGRVAGVPVIEKHRRLTVVRKASLYLLRDLSYSSYFYIATALPILLAYTVMYILRECITLLHANGFLSGLVCLAASALTGVPYVITIQSADFTIYHEEVRLNFIVRLQSYLERLMYRRAAVCHAVSNDLCRHYRNQGIEKCVMIPNGVETELFMPITNASEKRAIRRRYHIPENAFAVVNVSRLESKNGVAELIDAVGLLIKEGKNVVLVLVGDGSERDELARHVREKGIEKRVLFLGEISHNEVGPIVASADAFARTPRSEGFGIVFLEAMSAGVPVVGTNVGGIPDFLKDGETGLLCEVENQESIASALRRLVDDESLRTRLVEASSRLVQEKYDWDVIAERFYEEVYSKVV